MFNLAKQIDLIFVKIKHSVYLFGNLINSRCIVIFRIPYLYQVEGQLLYHSTNIVCNDWWLFWLSYYLICLFSYLSLFPYLLYLHHATCWIYNNHLSINRSINCFCYDPFAVICLGTTLVLIYETHLQYATDAVGGAGNAYPPGAFDHSRLF